MIERHAGKMGADDEQRNSIFRSGFGQRSGRKCRIPRGPHAEIPRPVHPVGEGAKRTIAEGRRHERHAEGQSVAAKSGRHGDRASVEQIDEIGIAPEPLVESDRIGDDFAPPYIGPAPSAAT